MKSDNQFINVAFFYLFRALTEAISKILFGVFKSKQNVVLLCAPKVLKYSSSLVATEKTKLSNDFKQLFSLKSLKMSR
jgi:hypothetical protein